MLADDLTGPPRSAAPPDRVGPASKRSRSDGASRAVTALAAAGVIVAYAVPGGAYDLVIRQEYGLVTWAVVPVGFALGLLPRARPSRGMLIVLGTLCAYTAWVGLSLAWTVSAERTTTEFARALDYLGLCVLFASVLDRRLWRAAATGVGFGAMIVCGLSVASRLFPAEFPANSVGVVFQTDRLSYPFGYWNAVGAWGAMSVAIGLGWSANDGSTARRAGMLGGVPLAGTMTYLSYSRASIVGTALAVIVVLVLSRHRWTALIQAAVAGLGTAITIVTIRSHSQIAHATGTKGAGAVFAVLIFACVLCMIGGWLCTVLGSDRWRLPRLGAQVLTTACVVAGVLAAVAFGPHLASRGWREFRNPALPPTGTTQRLTTLSGTRYDLWSVALDAFEAKPLTGVGAGTYEFWWNQHQKDSEFVRNAHSIWFETMAELGLPGLIAILAFVTSSLALLVAGRRRSRRRTSAAASTAVTAAFIVFLLPASVDWMWQSTAVTVLALGGLMAGASRLSQGEISFRWWLRGGSTVLAAAIAVFQLPGVLSTLAVRRSQTAEQQGDGPVALTWARDAVNAEPWAATPYEQRGLVLESAGKFAAAAANLRHAIANEPTNYTHWLILARIETEQGRLPQAARDYAHAHTLRTMGQVFAQP